MSIAINPYVVHVPITGAVEVKRGDKVVKYFGDSQKAAAYAEGRWDAERGMKQQWRRIIRTAEGEQVENMDSHWYDQEAIADSLMNNGEPFINGHVCVKQTRWVSAAKDCE